MGRDGSGSRSRAMGLLWKWLTLPLYPPALSCTWKIQQLFKAVRKERSLSCPSTLMSTDPKAWWTGENPQPPDLSQVCGRATWIHSAWPTFTAVCLARAALGQDTTSLQNPPVADRMRQRKPGKGFAPAHNFCVCLHRPAKVEQAQECKLSPKKYHFPQYNVPYTKAHPRIVAFSTKALPDTHAPLPTEQLPLPPSLAIEIPVSLHAHTHTGWLWPCPGKKLMPAESLQWHSSKASLYHTEQRDWREEFNESWAAVFLF